MRRLKTPIARTAVSGAAARVLVAAGPTPERDRIAAGLRQRGYESLEVANSEEAIAQLERGSFALLLCEHDLDGMAAPDLVLRALQLDANIASVVHGTGADAATVAELLSSGAYDYVLRPSELSVVLRAVSRALERREREMERRRVERAVRETVILRSVQIEKERAALRNISVEIVQSLVRVLEAKDPYLRGHSERVALISARIAEELRVSASVVESVRTAARLHDVGMVGIPEKILGKPGPLTAEEFELVKSHVDLGLRILAPVRHLGDALLFVRDHHEWYNGAGYPRGIAGEDISLGGRIIAAADAYDALTSARAFRPAYSSAEALTILRQQAGKRLDPRVFAALERVADLHQAYTLL